MAQVLEGDGEVEDIMLVSIIEDGEVGHGTEEEEETMTATIHNTGQE